MITNGSLLLDNALALVNSGLDELNVSLDAGRKLHDEIRGMPGLFEKITDGLKLINHYKKEKGSKKPLINLQCTITRYNYQHLEELVEVGYEAEADSLTYHNLIFISKEQIEKQKNFDRCLGCSSLDWEGFVFAPEIDPDTLYTKVQSILGKQYPFSVDVYPNLSLQGLREYYKNSSYIPGEYPLRCLSPWIVAYVFPNGEIRPCLNFSYAYGNIKENKFARLWNNDKAMNFRRALKTNKIFPVCVRCTELYRY